jgi:hypothetical protein
LKIIITSLQLATLILIAACTNKPQPLAPSIQPAIGNNSIAISIDTAASNSINDTIQRPLKGDFCFIKTENKDTTTIRLRILSDDDIRGEMIWSPWQKDGAVGTLTGKLNAKKELELVYDYTIEGNRQSETKTMKIEKNKLYIKNGKLIDPQKNGKLIYLYEALGKYNESLNAINCD